MSIILWHIDGLPTLQMARYRTPRRAAGASAVEERVPPLTP